MIQTVIKAKDIKYLIGLTDPKHHRELCRSIAWEPTAIAAGNNHSMACLPVSQGPSPAVLIPVDLVKASKGNVLLSYNTDTLELSATWTEKGQPVVNRVTEPTVADSFQTWSDLIPKPAVLEQWMRFEDAKELGWFAGATNPQRTLAWDFSPRQDMTTQKIRITPVHTADWQTKADHSFNLQGQAGFAQTYPRLNPKLLYKLLKGMRGPVTLKWRDPRISAVVILQDKQPGVRLIMPINI